MISTFGHIPDTMSPPTELRAGNGNSTARWEGSEQGRHSNRIPKYILMHVPYDEMMGYAGRLEKRGAVQTHSAAIKSMHHL